MPTHNQHSPEHGKHEVDASAGFERTDANVTGIVVFLTALGIFVIVTGFVCYGIGKVFNAYMNHQDGPTSKWSKTADVRELGNLPSSPELQNKVAELTQTFPTPRVQTDDGNQDVADLHARENLLLENYTLVDKSSGKVRIPIERAMELMAQRGYPVAPAAQTAPLMTGDSKPTITLPLTNGFAPTGYEQEEAEAQSSKTPESAQK